MKSNQSMAQLARTKDWARCIAKWITRGQWIRFTNPFAVVVATCASLESSSAQPVTGTAPAKPLDPKELDAYLAGQLSRKPFVGISVAVMQGGQVTFCKGYGYASKETKAPVDIDTRFAVASVTKEFTAACILLLSEEGKLSVDDPVAKYFQTSLELRMFDCSI